MAFDPTTAVLADEPIKESDSIASLHPNKYDTILTPDQEQEFQQWKQVNAPNDSGEDYDLRGAFQAGLTPDEETGHWPDTFKKPNHPTFSDESKYADSSAGTWVDGNYLPATLKRPTASFDPSSAVPEEDYLPKEATRHLQEYDSESKPYGDLPISELYKLNLIAQQGKPFGQRFLDKLTGGDYERALKDVGSGVVNTFSDYISKNANLIGKSLGDLKKQDWAALYDNYLAMKQEQKNVIFGVGKGVTGLLASGADLGSSGLQALEGVLPVSPESEQQFDASLNAATTALHHGLTKANQQVGDLIGAQSDQPETKISEILAPLAVPLGGGEALAGDVEKLAGKVVEGADRIGATSREKIFQGLSKSAPVVAKPIARAPEAAIGAAVGGEFGHMGLGALAASLIKPGRMEDAVEAAIQSKADELASDARSVINAKGVAPIDAVSNALQDRIKNLQEAIDVGRSKIKPEELDLLDKAITNPDIGEHLSGTAKKVLEQRKQMEDLANRVNILEKNKSFALFSKQAGEILTKRALHGGLGAGIMGGLAGASSPPGDTQSVPEGVISGGLIGAGGSLLGLPSEIRSGIREHNLNRLVDLSQNNLNGHDLQDTTNQTIDSLPKPQQDTLRAKIGLAVANGGNVVVLPGDELPDALNKYEGVKVNPDRPPAGYYSDDTKTAYINSDQLESNPDNHEITHSLDQAGALSAPGTPYGDALEELFNEPSMAQPLEDAKKEYERRANLNLPEGHKPVVLDKAGLKSEITADLGSDILRKHGPEGLYGGKSALQSIESKLRAMIGQDTEKTGAFGFPTTQKMTDALTERFFQAGANAKAMIKEGKLAPSESGTYEGSSEPSATLTPEHEQNAPQTPSSPEKQPSRGLSDIGGEIKAKMPKDFWNPQVEAAMQKDLDKAIKAGEVKIKANGEPTAKSAQKFTTKWLKDNVEGREDVLAAVSKLQKTKKPFKITFNTKEGTPRVAEKAQFGVIPEGKEGTPRKDIKIQANPHAYKFFDQDLQAYRQFHVDRVQKIEQGEKTLFERPPEDAKAKFMPTERQYGRELLGDISDEGDVRGRDIPKSYTHVTHEDYGLNNKKWRYDFDTGKVYWWEKPTEKEKDIVEDWLNQKHLDVTSQHGVLASFIRDQAGFIKRVATGREFGRFMPSGDKDLENVIKDYTKSAGIDYVPHTNYRPINEQYSKDIADQYEQQPHEPNNPKVVAGYNAFRDAILGQYKTLIDHGYKIEPWPHEGQPYANSADMLNDLRNNKHLYYFETERGYGEKGGSTPENHPMLRGSGIFFNGKEAIVNDIFRGVHDALGHGHMGWQFGPRGEYNAFLSHKSTLPPESHQALATETLGQNSWTNFGPHMRGSEGNILKPGEPGYLPITERPYTRQRANLLKFMPSAEPDAIKEAAIKLDDGTILSSNVPSHSLLKVPSNYRGGIERGWLTNKNEFVDNEEAYNRALRFKQIDKDQYKDKLNTIAGGPSKDVLEGNAFFATRKDFGKNETIDIGGNRVNVIRQPRGDSRPVDINEFKSLAKEGKKILDNSSKKEQSISGLTQNWDQIKQQSWEASQHDWGGVTIDPKTGENITPSNQGEGPYALSVKTPGQTGIRIDENSTREQFDNAMDRALDLYPQIKNQDHYLGVFHDNDTHSIDIDPIYLAKTKHEVEAVGSYTNAVGGAYDYSTGNGVFPPHVTEGKFMPDTGKYEGKTTAEERRNIAVSRYGLKTIGETDKHLNIFDPVSQTEIKVKKTAPFADIQKKVSDARQAGRDDMKFMPSDHPEAIKEAAIRMKNGDIHTGGALHAFATEKALDHALTLTQEQKTSMLNDLRNGDYDKGWVNNKGEYRTDAEAEADAQRIGQGINPKHRFMPSAEKYYNNLPIHKVDEIDGHAIYSTKSLTPIQMEGDKGIPMAPEQRKSYEDISGIKESANKLEENIPSEDIRYPKFDNPLISALDGGIVFHNEEDGRRLIRQAQAEGHDGVIVLGHNSFPESMATHSALDKTKWALENPDKVDWEASSNHIIPIDKSTLEESPGPSSDRLLDRYNRGELTKKQLNSMMDKHPLFMPSVEDQWGEVHQHLTPEERASIRDSSIPKVLNIFRQLPDLEKAKDIALKGKSKKEWYQNSAKALSNVFGPDADRFGALLSSLSPQVSVEANLKNALNVWANWLEAGRPTGQMAIEQILNNSVAGEKSEASVLGAWKNNVIRSLTADDPSPNKLKLSGPKVNSFYNNLRDNLNEVTNDRWMKYYAFGNREAFRARGKHKGILATKGFDYIAFNAHIRQLSQYLSSSTGEHWSPAEVQAAIWSYTKTVKEASDKAGLTEQDYIQKHGEPDVSGAVDFAQLFNTKKKKLSVGALRNIADSIQIKGPNEKGFRRTTNPF